MVIFWTRTLHVSHAYRDQRPCLTPGFEGAEAGALINDHSRKFRKKRVQQWGCSIRTLYSD